ncbi:MAG: sodium:solute symporter family protein [Candidatus Neomarinimicrobiota bacterium]
MYFWTIILYLLALIVVGAWRSRKVKTKADFMVAGRNVPSFVLLGTLLATWIGTGSIFGNAEKTYEVGVAALILPLAGVGGIAVLSAVAGRARRFEGFTVPDILEARYNKYARVFGTITVVTAYITIVSYQFRAGGAVLHLIYPALDPQVAVIIAAIFVIAYTALAGMSSVVYTDVVNGVLMTLGLIICLPVLMIKTHGFSGMRELVPADHFQFFGRLSGIEIIGLLLPAFLLVLGDANMYQRFFSARDEGTARRAVIWLVLGVAVVETVIILNAFFATGLHPHLKNPGHVILNAAFFDLPVFFGAIMLATIVAIVVSTADSYLLVPSTSVVNDIYMRFIKPDASDREIVLLSRVVVIVLGVLAYYLSTLDERFLAVALYAYTIYGAGITPALLAAFFWKRVSTPGALSSIVSGTVMTVVWKNYGLSITVPKALGFPQGTVVDAVIPAIIVSVVLLVVVSLATKPTPEKYERFAK